MRASTESSRPAIGTISLVVVGALVVVVALGVMFVTMRPENSRIRPALAPEQTAQRHEGTQRETASVELQSQPTQGGRTAATVDDVEPTQTNEVGQSHRSHDAAIDCPTCRDLAAEVDELRAQLARTQARLNELSFAALEAAYPVGTPIGDAVRQAEFLALDERARRAFVELMAAHFPIDLTPSEVDVIAKGVAGTGDPQFEVNLVDASIRFLGARRILDEVASSDDSSQLGAFDREYVEYLAASK